MEISDNILIVDGYYIDRTQYVAKTSWPSQWFANIRSPVSEDEIKEFLKSVVAENNNYYEVGNIPEGGFWWWAKWKKPLELLRYMDRKGEYV